MNRILIVDDQLYIRALIKKELAKEGFQVNDLNCVKRIWENIQNYQPDLVLLGLNPESYDCWRILEKAKREVPNLPVLICVIRSIEDIRDLKQAINEVLGYKSFFYDKQPLSYPTFYPN